MIISPLDDNFRTIGPPISGRAMSSLICVDRWEDHSAFQAVVKRSFFPGCNAAKWAMVEDEIYEMEKVEDDKPGLIAIAGPQLSRVLGWVAIEDVERLRGNLEERVRYLVTKYALSGQQRIPKLVLEPLQGLKRAIDVTTEPGGLDKFLFTVLNERGFSYRVTYNPDTDELVFGLLQGKDRTQGQSTNRRALFTENEKNLDGFRYSRSNNDHFNAAVVSDEDETAPTKVFVDKSMGERLRVMYVKGAKAKAADDGTVPMHVLAGGGGYIAVASDGETFTTKTSGTAETLYGGGYSAGKYTLCGSNGKILSSVDANTWTNVPSGVTDALEDAYIYDGLHMVVGNAGQLLTSYDNVNYTAQTVPNGVKLMTPFRGERVFVIASSNSRIYTTEDGVTNLKARAVLYNGQSCGLNGISVADGKIVAVGYRGSDYPIVAVGDEVSEEALTVTAFPAITGGRFTAVIRALGVWVAIGQPNIIYWSEDLLTWYDGTPAGGTPDYIALTFDGTTIRAYSSTTKHLASSTDGKTFTLKTITLPSVSVQAAFYGTSSLQNGLTQVGLEALQNARKLVSVNGTIVPGRRPAYGTDYSMGDVVDIASDERDIIVSKRATEMRRVYEAGRPSHTPTFGDKALAQKKFIQKEIAIRV